MRNIAACLLLVLMVVSPAAAQDHAAVHGEGKKLERPKAQPNAGQSRRRAVRKTTPVGAIARADTYSVALGATLTVIAANGVLANDSDPQSRPLTAILVSTTAQGTLALSPDGSFVYVSNSASASTSDSFTYKANNGLTDTNTAVVTITITPPPPIANVDEYVATRNTVLAIAEPGVLTNDTINAATIASYGVAGSEQTTIGTTTGTSSLGSVSVNANGSLSYTPQTNFLGQDFFKYTLRNSAGSSVAQVNFTVVPPAPVALNDAYTTNVNVALSVPGPGILANDTVNSASIASYGSVNGNEQTTIGTATPTNGGGSVRVFADGAISYTPVNGFSGTDSFRYVLSNGGGNSIATVTITVNAGDAIDFTVTAPGFFFVFSGVEGQNPTLTLQRGRTYRFRVQTTSLHPFEILGAPDGSVTNNNTSTGILTFAVPANGQSYEYHCSIHAFGGMINTSQ